MKGTSIMLVSPNRPRRRRAWLAAAIALISAPVVAQRPPEAEIDAVRKSCRGDYISHCRGVPTGGAEALNCLKQNFSQLSPTCKAAVEPLMPPAAAPGAPPAKAAPRPGSTSSVDRGRVAVQSLSDREEGLST